MCMCSSYCSSIQQQQGNCLTRSLQDGRFVLFLCKILNKHSIKYSLIWQDQAKSILQVYLQDPFEKAEKEQNCLNLQIHLSDKIISKNLIISSYCLQSRVKHFE
jgi:hypothetical protein